MTNQADRRRDEKKNHKDTSNVSDTGEVRAQEKPGPKGKSNLDE